MEYSDLTDDQKKKLDTCETPEDILALAREEGVELTPEQVEMVNGGFLDGVFGDDDDDTPLTERWKEARRN